MEILLLVLIPLVIVFGIGVLLVSRARAGRGVELEPPPSPPLIPPPRRPEVAEPGVLEPEVEVAEPEVEVVEPEAEVELVEAEAEVEVEPELEELVRPRFRDRLARARAAMAGAFAGVRGRAGITDDTWDDLEEALLVADVGVGLTGEVLDELRGAVKAEGIKDPDTLLETLKGRLKHRLGGVDRDLRLIATAGRPDVWLFVGVNGVGKTTTIGKVAAQQRIDGHKVTVAAADTFRAAAAEQLETWAHRAGADFVRGAEGADPGAVVFDAVQRAAARDSDLVLADTAGRLHTKTNLMDELRKVRRVADREPGQVSEVLLVIDATTGQNGLTQARQFTEAVEVTGVVLTKLDGSAKGGIVLAIQDALGIPVKLVGLGETIGDLVVFDEDEFVDALFE